MASPPFRLQRIKAREAITDKAGMAVTAFIRFWDSFCKAIETAVVGIQAVQAQQAQQLELIQQAIDMAASALEGGAGGDNRSGSIADIYSLNTDGVWTPSALVSLTGVVAGNLTIPGTGPRFVIGATTMSGGNVVDGEYRVVEVVGGIDTILFTGTFRYLDETGDEPQQVLMVNHYSTADVSAFVSARSSTGVVDYRVDVRRTGGANLTNARFYLFVRRAA